ncbi:MAG TPA: general secretion pathway protein GspB [Noviherbaspirillum sp.]|uniref:general secretion pathway protein GspB n=1 Tax=Noviherbaspirillum sp. TaxID=1926288 RepID=UPI002D54173A|nr:general secretion pathway protein GspB [Noviherbaspirillum sp.]HYD94820.1 general secretion pathway protein GspB [Noviherbaspirillum sp.]
MSYILEALKKAEAERKGGALPKVQILPPIAPAARNAPAWRRPLPSAALASLAVTLACAGWYAVTRDKPAAPSPAASPAASPSPAVAAPAPAAAPPVARAEPAATGAQPATPPADTPPAGTGAPASAPKEKPARKRAEKKTPPASAEARTAKAAPAEPREPPAPALRDLPEQIQREIPALAVGGYIYSGSKADRSVLINQRLLREGDEVAPGLVLERMLPNGMVLNYRGHRYRRGY